MIDNINKLSYYLYTGHRDVVQTVSEAGNVENQYDYDIFGNPILTVKVYSNAIRYAGEFYDEETGLYYLRARYYNPYIGRFISEDSYWGEDTNSLSLNLYVYCYNDSIKFVDPTGHVVSEADKKNLSKADQDKIQKATDKWNDANAKGDKKGMEAAHKEAEAIRAGKGYSGGTDGSENKIIRTSSSSSRNKDDDRRISNVESASSIDDWVKMSSKYSYDTPYGKGQYHYYKNLKTGEIHPFDAKLKLNNYPHHVIPVDLNFDPIK